MLYTVRIISLFFCWICNASDCHLTLYYNFHSYKGLLTFFLPYRYDIQIGVHDPYEDCVSVMRLYKRMRSQDHRMGRIGWSLPVPDGFCSTTVYDSWKSRELEQKTPDELFRISRSNYKCWCLDSRQAFENGWNTPIKMANSWKG